jgi:hypothetical protein
MSVHAGEIPLKSVVEQFVTNLAGFDAILHLYRAGTRRSCTWDSLKPVLEALPSLTARKIHYKLSRGTTSRPSSRPTTPRRATRDPSDAQRAQRLRPPVQYPRLHGVVRSTSQASA